MINWLIHHKGSIHSWPINLDLSEYYTQKKNKEYQRMTLHLNSILRMLILYFVHLDSCVELLKIQKYNFLSVGPWEHLEWHGITHSSTGATEVPFFAKMTKTPLVSPRFDQRSNVVQTLTKQLFSQFYFKPKLLGGFQQVWPEVHLGWT